MEGQSRAVCGKLFSNQASVFTRFFFDFPIICMIKTDNLKILTKPQPRTIPAKLFSKWIGSTWPFFLEA